MSNPAHLVRKQSSRELKPPSADKLELKELRSRLVPRPGLEPEYGTTNAAFEEPAALKVSGLEARVDVVICAEAWSVCVCVCVCVCV